jgi:hypothetical protein
MQFIKTNESIIAYLSANVSNQPTFISNYGVIDQTTSEFREATSINGVLNNTNEISIIPTPNGITDKRYDVKHITIYNPNVLDITIFIAKKINTTNRIMLKANLKRDWTLVYDNSGTWNIKDESGLVLSSVASADWGDITNIPSEFNPSVHASSHVTGGSDIIPNAISNGNSGLFSGSDKAKLDNITGSNTGDETVLTISNILNNATNKNSLIDTDVVSGLDSSNSFSLIKTTWTNIKTFLKVYFDSFYVIKNSNITPATNTKVTYDAKGLITSGTGLVAGDIPNLAQSQITSLTTDLNARELLSNKSNVTSLGNSTNLYPTQNAVKSYVDNFLDIDLQTANIVANSSTNSTTFINLPGASLTTTGTKTKKYRVSFNGVFSSSTAQNANNSIRFVINGVAQTVYNTTIFSTDSNRPNHIGNSFTFTIPPTQIVLVQYSTTNGTMTMVSGNLSISGIG